MAIKNVTLSAEDRLLEKVRANFERKGTSLNERFREWLEQENRREIEERLAILQELRETVVFDSGGMKLTREEMNEREPRA